MKKILFVCHGNICRSPMAEFIMKKIAATAGVAAALHIESAATSSEEIGNSVYPPAVRELARHGISCEGKRARRINAADFDFYDMVVVMEDYNLRNLRALLVGDAREKVWKLLDFEGCSAAGNAERLAGGDISDPWYHGNFSQTYAEIERGCNGLITYLGM
ncbi:MAG: low molecular weight phosphotyrosine protein phosphatase [Bacteroidaceae bacterium]|nr:low molecular weight phosphotyrosine protein phosphatase [Bacteroidaceae bacterium]